MPADLPRRALILGVAAGASLAATGGAVARPLSAPTKVLANPSVGGGITVTWQPVKGATSYTVEWIRRA